MVSTENELFPSYHSGISFMKETPLLPLSVVSDYPWTHLHARKVCHVHIPKPKKDQSQMTIWICEDVMEFAKHFKDLLR